MANPIIYIKDLSDTSEQARIDFSHTLGRFDFLDLVHRTNLKHFRELTASEETRALVPDVIASVMAQLQETGFLADEFVKTSLYGCNDVLVDRGYEFSFLKHLYENIDNTKDHIIMVAGCQVREMLHARVDAALSIIRGLEIPFKVVFCGNNPGTAEVRMLHEAREMEAYFNFKLEEAPIGSEYRTFKVEVDEKSNSTITNVEEFLKKEEVITSKNCSVFIASSLFHLLRLSSEFEKQLVDYGKRESINRIILCGAENSLQPTDVARSRGYVKSMMFDLMSYLIERNIKNAV